MDAFQKLEVVDGVHGMDVIRRHRPLLANGRVARVGQQVAVVRKLDPATLQQYGQHLDPRPTAQGIRRNHAPIGTAGGGAQ